MQMAARRVFFVSILMLVHGAAMGVEQKPQQQPQTQGSWHPYISLGGGMSTLLYSPQAGDYRAGLGGNFGLGLTYYFEAWKEQFELGLGIEGAYYNAKTAIDNYIFRSAKVTNTTEEPFYVVAGLTGYQERQYAMLLNVPIMLRYHFKAKTTNLFAGAGIKIGMPLKDGYKALQGGISARGYFDPPREGNNFPGYSNPPEWGFTNDNSGYSVQSLDKSRILTGTSAMLALEFGAWWTIAKNAMLYAALFADIGLNNMKRSSTASFVGYYVGSDGRSAVIRTSSIATALNTDQNGNIVGAMSKRIAPVAAGIKVAIYFGARAKTPDTPPLLRADTIRDTIIVHDTIVNEKIVEKIVELHDTIIKYDDAAPAPKVEPEVKTPPAAVDTTMPKHMVQERYIPDDVDRDRVKKKINKRSYQVQVLAARKETDMSYFDVLLERYPNFKLRTIKVGRSTHYTYGMFSTFEEARKWAYRYAALGYTDVFVVQVEGEKIMKSYYNNKQ